MKQKEDDVNKKQNNSNFEFEKVEIKFSLYPEDAIALMKLYTILNDDSGERSSLFRDIVEELKTWIECIERDVVSEEDDAILDKCLAILRETRSN
jgi:hypothetical protein